MKLQTPTKKKATHAITVGASATAGVISGRAANVFYPENKQTSGIAKAATGILCVGLMASISGEDLAATAAKGFLAGMSAEKIAGGIGDILVSQNVLTPSSGDSDAKKALLHGLDIKDCGCDAAAPTTAGRLILPALNYASQYKGMNMMDLEQNAEGTYSAPVFV